MDPASTIAITRAAEHNLRSVSLEFPKNKLIVVTGVSGSGKSSLIFDVLYREAESRYLGSFSSYARQFMGKMRKPAVEKIEGLAPAIAFDQKSVISNPRSTVGTITGIYDSLRLLFARCGKLPADVDPFPLNRSLFSFNSPDGACPTCKGLGVEDFLDPELLVEDDSRTLRQGALVITAPNGYIIYSQVTLDVLDQVCRSEGFNIDIPWKDLTPEQKHIVLYGSNKIEIPFGKHPLESRMKWSGITAKPREMDYYKGILPIMEAILQRDRNKNILRFVRTGPCRSCAGTRLNPKALSVTIGGYSIADLSAIQLDELSSLLGTLNLEPGTLNLKPGTLNLKPETLNLEPGLHDIASPIISHVCRQIDILTRLGLKHLSINRESTTLSGGETQRLRLATLASVGLSGLICIFDEPSIGLHPVETGQLIELLKDIRDRGNTVIVVEHDEEFILHADWLIDIGPGPGIHGGEVLFNGPITAIPKLSGEEIHRSRTFSFLLGMEKLMVPETRRTGTGSLAITGASANNLRNINVAFRLQALNVVTGVSGAGKSSLTNQVLGEFLTAEINGKNQKKQDYLSITGWQGIGKVITIDQSPIGRTPRSNPATYTGLFDLIRDLFARQPEAVSMGYEKSRFSFNTPGGRCETCQGAGYQQVGMHFMGNVEVLCESCEGRRFDPDTLEIRYLNKSISEVLDLSVDQALAFFCQESKIIRFLEIMGGLGLGYLTLGQRSSTLSGGEAQRIKLATELSKPQAPHTLYIMDEPSTGLHNADVGNLLKAIDNLIRQGHTVILTEHHPGIIFAADHIIDLGPGSGKDGGQVVATGTPEEVVGCGESLTGKALADYRKKYERKTTKYERRSTNDEVERDALSRIPSPSDFVLRTSSFVLLKSVSTNNLKHISLSIPKNKITVITGVSGSGKSSLAFDTIHAEAQNRFMEGFSTYIRSRIGLKEKPDFEEISGLTATLALEQSSPSPNPRSTIGTITGIYDFYRLLFSRAVTPNVLSTLFSFNRQHGACPACSGLGQETRCDVTKLITNPELSILDGAMKGTKTGKFYGDPFGQYTASIKAVGHAHGIDYFKPWKELTLHQKELVLSGSGEDLYEVTWEFKREQRTGVHQFRGKWQGLLELVEQEYLRKHADHRAEGMMNVMTIRNCNTCSGSRLKPEALCHIIGGLNIADLSGLPVSEAITFFNDLTQITEPGKSFLVIEPLAREIIRRLLVLADLGLPYLSINRPIGSLSAGEERRVRLASLMGSGISGITYILDEPTAGLHPRDTLKLMTHVRLLCDRGNTVILVEHDRDVILFADHVIDMGPGAGTNGGRVVAEGSPEIIMQHPDSLTGTYLRNVELKFQPCNRYLKPGLKISHSTIHNLKGFDIEIPAGGIVVVSGVSGSGKSSLVFDLIYESWRQERQVGCLNISGFENFSRIIAVEQTRDISSGTSVVATYTGLFDLIRDKFAGDAAAKASGISKNHFSFVNKPGQCPHCEGRGIVKTSMDFLPDVEVVCETCQGKRYIQAVLNIRILNKNIADVLSMTITEAVDFMAGNLKALEILRILSDTGLGYLTLGQSLSTLSGGEIQRLHLAVEMMKPVKGSSLYLFDEPTTGLHFHDTEQLLRLFDGLAIQGHSLLIIEHNPAVIAFADHVIELGPGGGNDGGFLINA